MTECLIAVIVLLYIAGAILMSCFIKLSGAEPGGLEIPLWPVVMFLAFFDATVVQIKRALRSAKMIEDGVYAATVVDRLFYRVEGDDIRIRVGGGEWVSPIIKTTRETIKIFLDAGELARVSDL